MQVFFKGLDAHILCIILYYTVPDSPYPSSSPVNAKGWNKLQYQSRHGYGGQFMAPPPYYYKHGYYPSPGPEYDGKRQRTDDMHVSFIHGLNFKTPKFPQKNLFGK